MIVADPIITPGSDETGILIFEQPLRERIRTFLRLDFLLAQTNHHLCGTSDWDTRAAIMTLLEISTLLSRGDVKSEVIKELERHALMLARLENSDEVDQDRLSKILASINHYRRELEAPRTPLGQSLKESEFINAIRNRSTIPGGTCQFDIPGYHAWLNLPHKKRGNDIESWLEDLQPLHGAVELLIQLTRESTVPSQEIAENGVFQKALPIDSNCVLIRVFVAARKNIFPEISAGRHRLTVRFMKRENANSRPRQIDRNINFRLACC